MLTGFWTTLASAQGDGSALSGSTTPTSLLPANAKPTIYPLQLQYVGQTLKLIATGRISTVVTTPGTLTLDLRFGGTVVFNGGAMTLNTVAQTNTPWRLEVDLTLRAAGSSANMMGQGYWMSHAVIGNAAIGTGGATSQMLQYNTAPAVGTNFDATTSLAVDFFGTWSVNSGSNSITLHQFSLISCA